MLFCRKHIITAIFTLSCFSIFGQSKYAVESFNTDYGLPSNYIQNCTIDSIGYLWVATKRGICRYDGYNFLPIKSLKGNILSIANNKKQALVFYENNKGLFSYHFLKNSVLQIAATQFGDSDPNNDHFNNTFIDSENRIWCTDFLNLKCINSLQSTKFAISDKMNETDKLATFTEPIKNNIWAATISGLFISKNASNSFNKSTNSVLRNAHFSTSIQIGANVVILATENRFYEVKASTEEIIREIELPTNEKIISIATSIVDNATCLVIGTKNKVFLYDIASSDVKPIYDIEQHGGEINAIYCASNNKQIWVCSTEGLIKLTNSYKAVNTITLPYYQSQGEDPVVCITQARNAIDYFIATASGSCYLTDLNMFWKKIILPASVNQIYVNDKIVLLSTNRGIYKYNGAIASQLNLPLGYQNAVIKKVIFSQNKYWLLVKDKPVLVLNADDFSCSEDILVNNNEIFLSNNIWNDIGTDYHNNIFLAGWMPSGYGLAMFDFAKNSFMPIANKTLDKSALIGDYYNKIAPSKKYNILISGYGGFNAFDTNGISSHIISMDNHPILNEHLEGICEMANQKIVFGTEEGMQIYNPANNDFTNITTINGLPSNNCSNAFVALDSNYVALGFNKAVSIVNTNKLFETILQNKIVLSSITINDSLIYNYKNGITIKPNQRNIVLNFSALNFCDPQKLIYEYKINDGNWQTLGSTPSLALANFKAGKYVIEVRVADNKNKWQSNTLIYTIIALPFFYETNWFFILIFILVGLIGWLLFSFRLRQLNRLNKFRQDISQDLHDDVGATLSSINILSSMLYSNTTLPTKHSNYLQRINSDVMQLQLKLDEIIWSLKKDDNSLHQIFTKLCTYASFILEAKNIQFIPKADEGIEHILIPYNKKRSIYLLVKEALNNIAKHSKATNATMVFATKNNCIYITIEDNGVGFNTNAPSNRNGLKSMHVRAAEIKANFNIQSDPLQGTVLTISIKYK